MPELGKQHRQPSFMLLPSLHNYRDALFARGLLRVREYLAAGQDNTLCLICLGNIKPTEAIWHCSKSCYALFHLSCIQVCPASSSSLSSLAHLVLQFLLTVSLLQQLDECELLHAQQGIRRHLAHRNLSSTYLFCCAGMGAQSASNSSLQSQSCSS